MSTSLTLTVVIIPKIFALLLRYEDALVSRSKSKLRHLFRSDGVFLPWGLPPAFGRRAIKSAFRRIFRTVTFDIELKIDEIQLVGEEFAVARTTIEGTKFWRKDGTEERHFSRENMVLRKVGQKWKIAYYPFRGTTSDDQDEGQAGVSAIQ